MRIGLMLSMPGDPTAAGGLVERAVAAEKAGFPSTWLPQVAGVDALTVLALAARETAAIELGTAVVPTYPRHPTVLAGQALTVQDVSGGRLALGIGLSHRFLIEDALGLDYSRPVSHMREYLSVLNALLAGERVSFRGEHYRVNAQVSLAAARPPVLVAALGPAMLRLCGRLAEGTITWMGGLDYLREVAVPTMSAAAAAVGRPAPRFVCMTPVLLSDDSAAARQSIDAAYQLYAQVPSYRATLERGGAATPSDVAIFGSEADLRAGLQAYAAAGATDLVAVVPANAGAAAERTRAFVGELAAAGGVGA